MPTNSSPLRILHYVRIVRMTDGGVVRAVLDWCDVLARRGHHLTLATWDATDVPKAWLAPSGSSGQLPNLLQLPRPGRFVERLSRVAMQSLGGAVEAHDVVHLHGMWNMTHVQIARLCIRLNKPYVVTTHGMLDDWSMAQGATKKKLYLRFFGENMLNEASIVHCTAREELVQAKKWFNNPNTAVIPYLFDTKPFETLPGPQLALDAFPALARPEPKILFLSRLHPKKGLEALISAVGQLRDQQQNLQLIIAGSGSDDYEKSLRKLAHEELNLTDRVTFTGLVDGNLKLSLYQSADLFVLPTSQENFGLVLPEALACETPVITTRGVDIWEELTEAGAIITDPSPDTLARAIHAALTDPIGLKDLGKRGRSWVFHNFNPDRITHRYEVLYRNMIGNE